MELHAELVLPVGDKEPLRLELPRSDEDKAGEQAWARICAIAKTVCDLDAVRMTYEDEEGDTRVLTKATVADFLWIAEGALLPAKIVVEPGANNVSCDSLNALLFRHLDGTLLEQEDISDAEKVELTKPAKPVAGISSIWANLTQATRCGKRRSVAGVGSHSFNSYASIALGCGIAIAAAYLA